ncbi:helix-turn-helix transcriptional regulator [Burkholderia sp. R-69980]|uniref:helix-turn-helix domain-containing protein n=1 Tax=Paraburkholderia domus TaxID=2793075 RepID=UPI001DE863A7|nr:helix-turn-helix transcriptional regulator [Paraburkholderia domus]MBK5119249.1 helix-turn-helix transcriptional regulator [Burkholderia sp. R-69980]
MKSTNTPQYRALLDRLIAARKAGGLSQAELASRLGRPQSFVAKIEIGERRLDVIEFLELARILGVTPASVLENLS